MERVAEITTILEQAMHWYADSDCWQCRLFYTADQQRQIYTVVVVPDLPRGYPARVVNMARIIDGKIVIEEDTSDRPLLEKLLQAGIPRELIVCVYAGEALPDAPQAT